MKLLNRARVRTDFIRGLITGFGNVTSRFISLDASSATNPMIRFMSASNEEGRIDYVSAGPMTVNSEAALVLQSQDGDTKLSLGNTLLQSDFNTGITIGAGTATVPPVLLNGTTLMTTPADGAIEIDATNIYGTTDAGNRGYIPLRHFIRLDGSRTFTSNTNPQVIFTSPANGRITLETGTYFFEGLLSFGSMSGTSGNLQLLPLGGGTATIANWLWIAMGIDGATATAANITGTHIITSTSPASVVTAGVGTSLIVNIQGTFECSVAGTFQPQIDMVTASATTLTAGSYISLERIGTTSVVSVGQWD